MKRIYVGNLDYGVTENSVRELFAKYGKVDSVAFIRDKESGIFRGFCFVNMEDEDSKRAIEKLNKTTFAGRIIEVMPANMKKRRKKKFEEYIVQKLLFHDKNILHLPLPFHIARGRDLRLLFLLLHLRKEARYF